MTGPRPRILYIDDDPGLARLVARTLGALGYEVEHAASGTDGLARLASASFDIVALDHHMPGQTGLDVLALIRALPNAPPVIYVTGSEDSRIAVSALKSGAVDYVWKDVQGHFRELLAEAVATALEKETLRRDKVRADQAVREARDRAELLLQEVNHRVANSLALVASLARLQSSAVAEPAAKQALADMQARIAAIAGVHRRLYTSEDVQVVSIGPYLRSLVEDLATAMQASGRAHAIRLVGSPDVVIPTDKAVSLGVVVTELVTNAYKYAYPGEMAGEIRVGAEREGDVVVLVVEDDGVGWTGSGETRGSGVGTRIVTAMARSLDSVLVFDPAHKGTRARVAFPIA